MKWQIGDTVRVELIKLTPTSAAAVIGKIVELPKSHGGEDHSLGVQLQNSTDVRAARFAGWVVHTHNYDHGRIYPWFSQLEKLSPIEILAIETKDTGKDLEDSG